MKKKNPILTMIVLAVIVFGAVYAIISFTQNADKNPTEINEEKTLKTLEKYYNNIKINHLTPVKGNVDLDAINMAESLPDIDKYPAQVEAVTQDFVEIFSSTEKATVSNSGPNNDRWLVDMAEAFNNAGYMVDGKSVSVRVRGIASGLGMDYISSGKYIPDAFSPSNVLWGDALKAMGVPITLVEKRLVGNVAGIVLSNKANNDIIKKYGSVSISNIIEAVGNGEIQMGYTNPFASSTGANFLMSTLYAFDNSNPLSSTAADAFTTFQTNIPYVAYTTLQMKGSALSGVLDGLVYEYQQYQNTPEFKSGYVFTPFGVRHDSPVYELGNLSITKKEILRLFIDFCLQPDNQSKATGYGFNGCNEYRIEDKNLNGSLLSEAQKLWKEKKAGDRDIIAVFVADVSGSMEGEPLNRLKESLLKGSKYIQKECQIGLVTFSNDVNIALPIATFDINQRSLFTGAVESMAANGGTAMFDAIIVAEKMLADAKLNNPNAKLMLFVLTDGDTNTGLNFNETRGIIDDLQIPIYTIGYNHNTNVLSELANIHEAATINADTDDVVYKLMNLFNAEM